MPRLFLNMEENGFEGIISSRLAKCKVMVMLIGTNFFIYAWFNKKRNFQQMFFKPIKIGGILKKKKDGKSKSCWYFSPFAAAGGIAGDAAHLLVVFPSSAVGAKKC